MAIIHRKVLMTKDIGHSYLCNGNSNDCLSYHLCFPHNGDYLMDGYIFRDRKFEIEEDICIYHTELKKKYGTLTVPMKVEPVQVVVEWRFT